jgi:pantoate--beta-alanine ligase
VTSVVARLFALVQPDTAVFGQKDYQQQLVIRHMSQDLNLPIAIVSGETVREDDGLAMSSRNQYLSVEERPKASFLFEVISDVGKELQGGGRKFSELESKSIARLSSAGFSVDYFSIRRAQDLEIPNRECDELVVLAAAYLGDARLIDNIVVRVQETSD